MKKVVCTIIIVVGWILFVFGLVQLKVKFGMLAWAYGLLASFGVLVYVSFLHIKHRVK